MTVLLPSSMTSFWRGPCLRSWSRLRSVHYWVPFLSAAEASLGLPSAACQLLAGPQCPCTQLRETQYQFCIFYIISLNIITIISVISKTFYITFVSLSPFSSFSLPLVGGWGLIDIVYHSVYWWPSLNCDTGKRWPETSTPLPVSKNS